MKVFSQSRSAVFGLLLIAAVIGVAFAASRATAAPEPTSAPVPVSAIESCHLPNSAEKGGGTLSFTWQLAVRQDSPEVSVLIFTSASSILTCETWRSADGNFAASTVTSIGGLEPSAGDELTYESGSTPTNDRTGSATVIGRAPRAAASIEIVTSDGERHMATIGGGLYLAWVTTTPDSRIVEIAARDSAGGIVARLADPAGLEPGMSGAPASS